MNQIKIVMGESYFLLIVYIGKEVLENQLLLFAANRRRLVS